MNHHAPAERWGLAATGVVWRSISDRTLTNREERNGRDLRDQPVWLLGTALIGPLAAEAQTCNPQTGRGTTLNVEDQPGLCPGERGGQSAFQRQAARSGSTELVGTIVVHFSERVHDIWCRANKPKPWRYGIGAFAVQGLPWQGLLKICCKAVWPDRTLL